MSLRGIMYTILLLFVELVISCSVEQEIDSPSEISKHISICVLGNSYSCDAFSYVPFLLKSYGISSDIHVFYRGGCSLSTLKSDWDKDTYTHFSIDTRHEDKWTQKEPMNPAQMVSLKKWDIVSLQQASLNVCKEESYYPYLTSIIEILNAQCPYDFDLAWFMAINRANNRDVERNLQTQKRVVEQNPFDLVLPVATAIFDCQNDPALGGIGDWEEGRLYCSDGMHLQEGLPCYIAALSVTQALLNRFAPGETVLGDTLRPTQEWIKSVNGITPNGSSVGVTEENCALAQKAALLANQYMFEVVEIQK